MTPRSGGRSAQPGLMPLQTATMMGVTLHLQSPARLLPRLYQQISRRASARLSWMKIRTAMRAGIRPKRLQVGIHLVGMLDCCSTSPCASKSRRAIEEFVMCSWPLRCWPDLL